MSLKYIVGTAALIAGAAGAEAQTTTAVPKTSPHVSALESCRALTEDAQRLRCYDAAAGKLIAANRSGELSVIGRGEAREVRRSLFGFSVPKLAILGGADDEEAAKELTAKVAGVRVSADGRYRVRLEDGAIWETVERPRTGEGPRQGSTVRIRKASLGSYFMNIDGRRAVRARRSE